MNCCEAMQAVIDNPVANQRGIKWQTMYNTVTHEESLDLVYHCGGSYWKTPVIKLNACPFCLNPVSTRQISPPSDRAIEALEKDAQKDNKRPS